VLDQALTMPLPSPRGPLSTALLDLLTRDVDDAAARAFARTTQDQVAGRSDLVDDDDVQITLLCLYELHHRGLTGVDDAWEWHPSLIEARRHIENRSRPSSAPG
jgi:hypothetical protein